MTYSFFQDQLQSAREHFAVEPMVVIWDGKTNQFLDEVKYTAYQEGNRIVLHFGASDVNWEAKFEQASEELQWAEKEIKTLQKDVGELEDELEEAEAIQEDLKREISVLESEKIDLESDLDVLKEEIEELEEKLTKYELPI